MRFYEYKFKGNYLMIGLPCGLVAASLSFHVVLTLSNRSFGVKVKLVHMVPEHWVDTDFRIFLYPRPYFYVNDMYPWYWTLVYVKKKKTS
jgi:hypothetical protein